MSTKGKSTSAALSNQNPEEPTFQVIDKRHFLDPDKLADGAVPAEKPRYPSFVEELVAKMEVTEKKFEERKQQMQEEIGRVKARLEADFQRRVDAERQKIVLPFLEVLDNLERAIAAAARGGTVESLKQGVDLVAGSFRSLLQASGIEEVQVLNQPFDPNVGQAVGMVAVSDPALDGLVVEELQRGYRMGGQLLRPAQVRVGQLQ